MANLSMNIPAGLSSNATMSPGDKLYITVTAACNWCYSDANGVFTGWPAAGGYALKNPPEVFTATAVNTGEVTVNSTLPGVTCTTAGIADVPRKIMVS